MARSLYSSVNGGRLPTLEIAEPDDAVHDPDWPDFEDVEDPKWLAKEHCLAYPPNPRFLHSYQCYLRHIACAWTANENMPSEDRDKFAKAPLEFQEIMMRTAGCIMIGDSVVLDKLHMNITPASARVMIESQIDRENTHQIVYSKWCDIVSDGDRYRSVAFRDEYMGEFELMVEKYAHEGSIQQTMFFIMLCENIMFAPMFQTINYCATLGYAPKLCNDNLLVMRDEYLHYVHARGLLAGFRRKIKISRARDILKEFCEVTMSVFRKIVGSYDDGLFNIEHVKQHFHHIVHAFMLENGLYRDERERHEGMARYSDSPARSYMTLPQLESKINLMESVSTVYLPPGPRETINMDF